MLKKVSKKLRAKFLASISDYSTATITRLDDAFSEFFKLEAIPVQG